MQTSFTLAQLADPGIAASNEILRKCVHCGFCTATCPTYVLLGDERDSPRGRIYLIKQMLESGKPATEETVRHVDRCLSCLSCMTTCPSSVHYMHLVDHARDYIEQTYRRPLSDRLLRGLLARVIPNPRLFRFSLRLAQLAKPFRFLLPKTLKAMVSLAPRHLPQASAMDRPQVFPAQGARRMRVALLTGCAQTVLDPRINEATIRLLTRHGCEVVVAQGAGCCGSLTHHMGKEDDALAKAKANIAAWHRELETNGLDAVVINASGCGTTVKDYGFMLRSDPAWAAKAATIASLAKDVTEVMQQLTLKPTGAAAKLTVAYHSACSLQHGQKITALPKQLLAQAGFDVRDVPEAHLCCGSAGTYNLLQPDLALQLRARKVKNIASTGAAAVAAGNIGCLVQIANGLQHDGIENGEAVPVLHTVELLDWATGGPKPAALS
ncbi:glycolate oxidase subunit GlcF [uncultured Ferrovibrio sp.]|mgnify:CR=1 FL=1|jgi:glycolate oxidase iron-sulfur subunit|uniref:glycolate oxidase subunit GlcF n=1 Tax=uncultured Ferrovibrio sp. TaxID=1576913 RepID=UPI00261318EA|nr:glycolate oxidase subunit GlcF [uncultured Ferrovibrio sp.]